MKPDDQAQSEAFLAKARELEADEDGTGADSLIGQLAKMQPQPRQAKAAQSFEQVVEVRGVPVTVSVSQKTKRVWGAVGVHFGHPLEVDGPTKEAAVAAWMTRAAYLKP